MFHDVRHARAQQGHRPVTAVAVDQGIGNLFHRDNLFGKYPAELVGDFTLPLEKQTLENKRANFHGFYRGKDQLNGNPVSKSSNQKTKKR